MKPSFAIFIIAALMLTACSNSKHVAVEDDNKSFEKLHSDLLLAFDKGDTATFAAYHHPDVVKALAWDKLLVGRNAVVTEMANTCKYYSLKFIEHHMESFEITGNTATEITSFAIQGIPKQNSPPFTFKGRSMVVYVRYKASPSGWALLREMIQPATEN